MFSLRFLNNILKKKKDNRIICPSCFGKGTVVIYRRPDRRPDSMDSIVPCPICNGTKYVPEYVRKKEQL
jgi:DnaJ-class molecular chaperone